MPHFDILEFCKQVDIELWNAYHQRQNITGRLVFPRYRNGEIRASEQEARFVFIEVMCRETAFRYSVETPTSNLYKFTGRTKESARTDMTLFDAQGSPICNIEFKSKGISLDAKEKSKIGKDLQKLIREPLQGLWFHLLESANEGFTLPRGQFAFQHGHQHVNALLCEYVREVFREFSLPQFYGQIF